jgi:short-subunit dehydrogenase
MRMRGEGEDKTALVTGASAGIGWHLAHEFAAHGFDLVLVARSREALEKLADELSNRFGVNAFVRTTDLSSPDAPRQLFDDLAQREIPIEVLVNNAGVIQFGRFHEIPLENLLGLLSLNAGALTAMTRLFVEPMLRGGGGRILNVASVAAFLPLPAAALYAATKAFVVSLSEALAIELQDTGVTVTALCPGLTATRMFDEVPGSPELAARLPKGIVMDPVEVARIGYRGCVDGVSVVVPGLPNQLMARLVGLHPRWLVRALGGLVFRRMV